MNKEPFLIGRVLDDDWYTIHILRDRTYYLLAEFLADQIEQVISQLTKAYPFIADRLRSPKTWSANTFTAGSL